MSIPIPYTFVTGEIIEADEVNADFTALSLAALNKTGDTITGNLTVAPGVTIDGVDISELLDGTGAGEFATLLTSGLATLQSLSVTGEAVISGTATFADTVTAAAQPRCSAYANAIVSLAAGGQVIAFDTEEYDVGDLHEPSTNPSRLTVPATGLYLAIARVCWNTTNVTGSLREIRINKNGTIRVCSRIPAAWTSALSNHELQHVLELTAGDYLEIYALHDAGANLNIGVVDARYANRLTVVKLW